MALAAANLRFRPEPRGVAGGRNPEFRPGDFDGRGPLAGWLYRNPSGDFQDGGLGWIPVKDKWDNAFLLAVVDGEKPLYDPMVLAQPHPFDLQSRRSLEERRLMALQPTLRRFEPADAANMAANGWDPIEPNYDFGRKVWIDYLDDRIYHFDRPWESLSVPSQQAIRSGRSAFSDYEGVGNPWIDGVPVNLLDSLPADERAKVEPHFGGWVVCRVNRWTRCAVITGLYYGGWGDAATLRKKANDPGRLVDALLATLLGLLQIIGGILCLVGTFGGCSAAGVALIVTGVITIVQGWYQFDRATKQQQEAVDRVLNGDPQAGGGGLRAGAFRFAKSLDLAKKRREQGAGVGSLLWVAAAVLGPLALK